MEFQPQKSYISCGNGCNAHFQNEDELLMSQMATNHSQKCSKATPYNSDLNAFYFVEETPITAHKPVSDYTNFNLKFMNNRDYESICQATTNQRSVTRMEALAIANNESFPLIKAFWDAIVEDVDAALAASAIEAWNAIAAECFMPFKFDESGKMVLL